jgi:hypothetical protein
VEVIGSNPIAPTTTFFSSFIRQRQTASAGVNHRRRYCVVTGKRQFSLRLGGNAGNIALSCRPRLVATHGAPTFCAIDMRESRFDVVPFAPEPILAFAPHNGGWKVTQKQFWASVVGSTSMPTMGRQL